MENFCQKFDIKGDSSFMQTLKEAMEQKDVIADIIFDKDAIIKFNDEYKVFGKKNIACILDAVDEISADKDYSMLSCAMYHFMKNDIEMYALKPPADRTVKSELVLMPPSILCYVKFCEDALKRGVDKEILSTTLRAVDMYLGANERKTGKVGTSAYHYWLPRYAMGRIFRLGAFQIERRKFLDTDALSVHIPTGTELDVKKNLLDLKYALEFFKHYYSEYDFQNFVCFSWLLNPHIEKIMGRATNITRFGDMFRRFKTLDDDEGVYGCVFKTSKPDNVDDLKEETSLQRNIKKFLKEGNEFRDYGGIISISELDEKIAKL